MCVNIYRLTKTVVTVIGQTGDNDPESERFAIISGGTRGPMCMDKRFCLLLSKLSKIAWCRSALHVANRW